MKKCFTKIFAASFAFSSLAIILVGCATERKERGVASYVNLAPVEDAIYELLSREPVPLPAATPYDVDKQERAAYIRGFLDGWHDVISGAAFHGTHGTRTTFPPELAKAWQAGWEAGCKPAKERWFQEFLRMRQE